MSQSSSHLSQELAALSDRFSELGERLLSAARQLHAPGTPPSDDLLESLAALPARASCRSATRALELAGALRCRPGRRADHEPSRPDRPARPRRRSRDPPVQE